MESGDSLGFISRKFYGDSSGIRKIMEANGLANADMIFEGQTLLIPEEELLKLEKAYGFERSHGLFLFWKKGG